MSGQLKDEILSLIEKCGASDRSLVASAEDEIKKALEHEVPIGEIYKVLCGYGFKGSRNLLTRILVEKGFYTVKRKPRKKKENHNEGKIAL